MGEIINMIDYKIDRLIFCELLPEMFKRVGLNTSDINDLTKTPYWFTSKSWTEEEQTAFKDWVVQKLRAKLRMSKKLAEKEANNFILNFGWTTNKERQLELNL